MLSRDNFISNNKGFTLIELSIALAIIGFLLAGFAAGLKVYYTEKKFVETQDNLKTVQAALSDFVEINGFLPCPTTRTIARGTAIPGAAPLADGSPRLEGHATDCTVAVVGGVTEIPGLPDPVSGINLPVRVGAIPYRHLGIPQESTMDAFGNRLTYAVTRRQTDDTTFDPNAPGIQIFRKDHRANTDAAQNAMFFVFSHGEDSEGAFSDAGVASANACGTDAQSSENCDGDAVFRSNIGLSLGTERFDDQNIFSLQSSDAEDELWGRTPSNLNNIANTNIGGNVGINTNTPTANLHVNGTTNIDGATTINADITVNNGDLGLVDGNMTIDTGFLTMTTGGIELSNGDLDVITGDIDLANGDLTLGTGSLTVTTGDIDLTNGALTLGTGDLTVTAGDIIASAANSVVAGGEFCNENGGNCFSADDILQICGANQALAGFNASGPICRQTVPTNCTAGQSIVADANGTFACGSAMNVKVGHLGDPNKSNQGDTTKTYKIAQPGTQCFAAISHLYENGGRADAAGCVYNSSTGSITYQDLHTFSRCSYVCFGP